MRLLAEPFLYRPWEIAQLTDDQIEAIILEQSEIVRTAMGKPRDAEPVEMESTTIDPAEANPDPPRPPGQWDYLKSLGLSDEEADAKLRAMRGE
jgi:hypothetical protein